MITKFHLINEIENYIFVISNDTYTNLINEINGAIYLQVQIHPYFHKNLHGIKVIRDLYLGLMLDEEKLIFNSDLAFIYAIRKTLLEAILSHPIVVDLKSDIKKDPQLAFYVAIHLFNYYAKHYIYFEEIYENLLNNELLEYIKNGDMREMFNPVFLQHGEYPQEIIQIQAIAIKFIVQLNNEYEEDITKHFRKVKQKMNDYVRHLATHPYLSE